MKVLQWGKDGGEQSHVSAFYIIEMKPLFSIVLLHFQNGTREAYHSHAFNAITWLLKGRFKEYVLNGKARYFWPRWKPKITLRSTFHKVYSYGDTWVLTFRGRWKKTWQEFLPEQNKFVTLTNGRKIIA